MRWWLLLLIPTVQACVPCGLDAMADEPPGLFHLEASLAGADPYAWPATPLSAFPSPEPGFGMNDLRILGALARLGIVDVRDEVAPIIRGHSDAVKAHGEPAAMAFQLWNLDAIRETDPELVAMLAASQLPDGSFACTGTYVSVDCTAWATIALAVHGNTSTASGAFGYMEMHRVGDGYGDDEASTITTAWVVRAQRAVYGATDARHLDFLESRQGPDGLFCNLGDACDAWTTSQAILALDGHILGPRTIDAGMVTRQSVQVGEAFQATAVPGGNVTWMNGAEGGTTTLRFDTWGTHSVTAHVETEDGHAWLTRRVQVAQDAEAPALALPLVVGMLWPLARWSRQRERR